MVWLRLLFSFSGRIPRSRYWLGFAAFFLVALIPMVVLPLEAFFAPHSYEQMVGNPWGVLSVWRPAAYIELILLYWIGFALYVKRCHDRDRSGWFVLILLIPVVGPLWLWIELGLLRGTMGPNRFGPDPLRSNEDEALV